MIAIPERSRAALRHGRGFTLIEFVVVIIIIGIIGSLGALIIRNGFRSYFAERDITSADAQAQTALARMTRELRTIRTATSGDLTLGASTLTFYTLGGTQIQYAYNASAQTLTRAENGGAAQVLADHVAAASFSYWQSDAQTTATTASAVYYITVQLTITRGVSSLTYRTTVHPRNFV